MAAFAFTKRSCHLNFILTWGTFVRIIKDEVIMYESICD